MKILVVQESDWIEKGPHQSHHLMERLSKQGHEVRVIDYEILWRHHTRDGIVSKRNIFKNEYKVIDGGGVIVIRPSIIKIPILDYISLLYTHKNEIGRQLDEFNPDVIIGFGILNAMLAIRLAKDTPFVYYILDSLHRLVPNKAFQPIAKYIESENMKRADVVLVINDNLKDYVVSMGSNPEKTYVVRAGIDTGRYDPNMDGHEIRKEYGIKEDDCVLFFMGTLFEFSGLKEVALSLAKIRDETSNIKLLLVGTGEAFKELQRIKSEHSLDDQIILTGRQPFYRIPGFIAAADICMLPAYNNEIMRDIVPIKMYEYMAMGKPVISTKLPGVMKEFGEGHGVIYVDKPEDVLRKAIELSDSLKEEGSKSRKYVEKYTWDDIVDDFKNMLEETIRHE